MYASAVKRRAVAQQPDTRLEHAAARLGIQFRNLNLLRQALTHLSYVNELSPHMRDAVGQSNERLEFLGDAVLSMLIAEFLYRRYPDATEGELTAYRAALVRTQTLARWARHLGLDDVLYLGRGERPEPDRPVRDRILAGAFEAVVGAVYLDRGLGVARRFLRAVLHVETDERISGAYAANYKGRLQELAQERLRLTPVYRTIAVSGPAHQRTFTAEVLIGERAYGVGHGPSKRAAEQEAARQAIERLNVEEGDQSHGTL